MLLVQDQIGVVLSVQGNDIPLGPKSFGSLSVMQNMNNLSGVAQCSITDVKGLYSKGLFSDQAEIQFGIGPAIDNMAPKPSKFRLFNVLDASPTTAGMSVTFTANYDSPEFFRKTMTKAYKGTSSSVLSQIAGEFGLRIEADGTSDSMTWLPHNRPYGQSMRDIADHGHAGGTSAMHLSMGTRGDGQWQLIYKDVMAQLQKEPTTTFISLNAFDPKSSHVPVFNVKHRSHAGTLNNKYAYGGNVMQTKMDGKTSIESQVQALQSSASINISSIIKSAVGALSHIVLPHDSGNVHSKFAMAQLQNEKLKATLSSFITVYTHYYTNVQIMDPVNVIVSNGEEIDPTSSGRYLVHSRTQYVNSSIYREMLVLSSQGGNSSA